MRKALNKEIIVGKVYEIELARKTVQDTNSANYGKPFIAGTLNVATDDKGMNVVPIHFTYVTEVTKAGKVNSTYNVLAKLIDEGKTILNDGYENATCVKCDTSLGLNDFYTNRDGKETLVQAKRNEGGFVSIVNSLPQDEKTRNRFEFDMLINGTRYVEADEEKHIDQDYLIVKGAVFNFKNDILPVELVCKNPGGIKFFESLDVSPQNMVFTKVWGNIHCETIVTKKVEQSAFGEDLVKEYERTTREWLIEGANGEAKFYALDDAENGITQEDIKQALANREVYLADVKKRNDEYQASKKAGNASVPIQTAAPAAAGGFNF